MDKITKINLKKYIDKCNDEKFILITENSDEQRSEFITNMPTAQGIFLLLEALDTMTEKLEKATGINLLKKLAESIQSSINLNKNIH